MSSYLDKNTQSARVFFRLVSDYVRNAKSWDNIVTYEIKPDESNDVTLISRRIYGNSDEVLTVMACAGLSGFDDVIPQGDLVLPTQMQLDKFKRQAEFESKHENRRDGKPRWSRSQ